MSLRNGLPEQIKLGATLAATSNPASPIIMGGDPEERICRASQLGYDALELYWPGPDRIPMKDISEACQRHDMKVCAFATGNAYFRDGLCLIDPDKAVRDAAVQRLREFVEAAVPWGAMVIIGSIRGNVKQGESKEAAKDLLAKGLRSAALYGQDLGVGFRVEAINRFENNYLNNSQEILAFLRDYQLPNVKIMLDTFHMNIEEPDPVGSILSCGNLLGYFHIADSNRLYPGAGHIPLQEIIDALRKIDYRGPITAECLPLPDQDTALENWIKSVKDFF